MGNTSSEKKGSYNFENPPEMRKPSSAYARGVKFNSREITDADLTNPDLDDSAKNDPEFDEPIYNDPDLAATSTEMKINNQTIEAEGDKKQEEKEKETWFDEKQDVEKEEGVKKEEKEEVNIDSAVYISTKDISLKKTTTCEGYEKTTTSEEYEKTTTCEGYESKECSVVYQEELRVVEDRTECDEKKEEDENEKDEKKSTHSTSSSSSHSSRHSVHSPEPQLTHTTITIVQTMSAVQVSVPSDNALGACPALMCGSVGEHTAGVIVLQEWWGMNEQIKACAAQVCQGARAVTVVPDLYRGKMATDNEEAGHLMQGLDWQGAVHDIRGCARYLLTQGCTKVGVTGFCMGGALAMAALALVDEISCAVPFYGIPSPSLCDVTTITKPLQCHFAERDDTKGFASPDEWKPLQAKLNASLKERLEFHCYDCGHAFTNTQGPNYDAVAAQLAMDRMYAFFHTHLA